MGKWNKPQSQISEEFLQNEQRRKQMIIEAAKRRKQKQRKMQQQQQQQRKRQQQAFSRHKQQKKQAYVKYLRNNMHDKYQNIKKKEKLNQPEIQSASKWKTKDNDDLQGLDLQVNINQKQIKNYKIKQIQQSSKPNKEYVPHKIQSKQLKNKKEQHGLSQKRRMLQKQFQKMWEQQNQVEQQMMASKLIDSLDLDFDTVNRGLQISKKIKVEDSQEKQLNNIKDLIGYQSILMSIDQRNSQRKMFKNQIQSIQQKKKDQKSAIVKPAKDKKKQAKSFNQGELLNELKNKKQGKILNWANQQVQQADDLFSNCSTNTKKAHKTLKQINMQIKKQREEKQIKNLPQTSYNISKAESNLDSVPSNANMKKKDNPLQPIPQRKINMSRQKLRERSYQKKIISQKKIEQQAKQKREQSKNKIKENLAELAKERSIQRLKASRQRQSKNNSKSKQNLLQCQDNRKAPLNRSRTNSTEEIRKNQIEDSSKQKKGQQRVSSSNNPSFRLKNQNQKSSSKQNKVNQPELKKNIPINSPYQTSYSHTVTRYPPIPNSNNYRQNDSITIATQDQIFEVQSFIKNQLVSLNKEQRQLQQQIRQLHLVNKEKLKEVQQKYQIKTDYKHSFQIGQETYNKNDEQSNKSYKSSYKKQTQDELQQSLQRLDDMLLRKQITQKQKNSRITQKDDQQSSTNSFINPMSDPISLHKQVLQLAQNISRFQQEVEVQDGYKQKMMKKKQPKNIQIENKKQGEILDESQEICLIQLDKKNNNLNKPPVLDYSQKNSNINNNDFQDSIDAATCKINVNERLKKMLLDD